MFANDPKKRRVPVGVNARGFAIYRKGNRRHETSPSFGLVRYGLRSPRLIEAGAVPAGPHVGRGEAGRMRILEGVQAGHSRPRRWALPPWRKRRVAAKPNSSSRMDRAGGSNKTALAI